MVRSTRRITFVTYLAFLLSAGSAIAWYGATTVPGHGAPSPAPLEVRDFEPGWTLQVARHMPEKVSCLATSPSQGQATEEVYVGTGPSGGVYRFNIGSVSQISTPIALGMGDQIRFGECYVTALAVRDLDHDGIPELVALTSQLLPRAQPRLYIWSLATFPVLRGVASPEIRSSWSHGLGFTRSPRSGTDSVVSTYCGYGEVVEYQLAHGRTPSGFRYDSVRWKQVGQLPASGEWTQTADLDNDGRPEVCLATGFAKGQAAIEVYAGDRTYRNWRRKHSITEEGRFGNVRFLVGDIEGDGVQELVAWWCTDLNGGACEVIRYRMGPQGVTRRTVLGRGDGAALWPDDNQMTLADMNRDGVPEIWFSTGSGNLWRYDATRLPALARVLHLDDELGPIAAGCGDAGDRSRLYIAHGRDVLLLKPADGGTTAGP